MRPVRGAGLNNVSDRPAGHVVNKNDGRWMLSWTSLPSTPLQDIIGGVITRDSKRVLKPLNRHMTQIVSYSKPKEMVERAKIADQIYLLSHAMRNFLMYYTFQLHCWE